MYGETIGRVYVDINFDEDLPERVEESFSDYSGEIESEVNWSNNIVVVKSTKFDSLELIDILLDNGIVGIELETSADDEMYSSRMFDY